MSNLREYKESLRKLAEAQSVEKGAKSGIAKQFHRAPFFENIVAIIIHLWDAFFLEKSVPSHCKTWYYCEAIVQSAFK